MGAARRRGHASGSDSLARCRVGPPAGRSVVASRKSPDYFRTLGIPLISGRVFTEADAADAPSVGIVDERIAKTILRGTNPIGRRFRVPVPGAPWLTIVGVVGHIRHDRLDDDGRPQVYWPYKQRAQDRMALVVQAHDDAETIGPTLAAVIRSVGRLLAALLYNVTSSDVVSLGSATLVLFLVALAACGLPARRAARVDPSAALRAE